ncbi:ATP-binding protein, partial [Streptomyces oryzae]|nr:ATP-binding protein [Streptomyces oryzae]
MLEPLWQGLPTPDAASVSGSASCALPPRYEAVSSARDFTRRTLRHWGLTEEFDDVALVVSELVTNAMRHGLTPGADHGAASGDEGDPPVRLHLMRWSARLVCAVRDPSDQPPDVSVVRRAAAHREAHGGFGDDRGRCGGHGGRTALADSMEYGGSMDRGGSLRHGSSLGNGGHGGNG